MFTLKPTSIPVRRALLVGVYWNREPYEKAVSLLDELRELVNTLGITVVEQRVVKSIPLRARYLIGSGKMEEIVAFAQEKKVDVIVFDHSMSPAQQRNWEAFAKIPVIDREEIILDIFARRACTREARLQVELARMEYSFPRLTRAWGHLSRQGGSGLGAMGAGETQLETDRRLIRRRIDHLKIELEEIRLQRATRRKQRQRHSIPHAAIVGYTNAGKSSLFHQLTGVDVLVEDKLFATLDTTTRQLNLSDGQLLLLTDTVGFIRKLPHLLVESFKATLEESVLSDFLVHVLDVNSEEVISFYHVTMNVLEELGADVKKMITVFNKVDLMQDPVRKNSLQRQFPDALFVSALTGEGMDRLKVKMEEMLSNQIYQSELLVPQSRYDLVSGLHRQGCVLKQSYEGDHIHLFARLPHHLLPIYEDYVVNGKNRPALLPMRIMATGPKTQGKTFV